MNRAVVAAAVVLSTLAAGCRASDKRAADSSSTRATAASDTTASHADSATTSGAGSPAPKLSSWVVSDAGAGDLRIGMTRDQLAINRHEAPPAHTKADSGCAYLDIIGLPAGMRTMWVAATLARIDIIAPNIATDRGAAIGDPAARIDSLYQGRVTSSPAKYDPRGSYLVVRSAAPLDSMKRLVFETDSTGRVTRYRVGREPEVEWVEGCS